MRGAVAVTSPTILLVGFEERMAGTLDANLRPEGFRLLAARTEQEALAFLSQKAPRVALVHLDPMDPGALAVCKEIRARSLVPIILVSTHDVEAEHREAHTIAALDAGADDYVSQPHRLHELVARVRAAMRRSPATRDGDDQVVQVGDLVLDQGRHEVRLRDRKVALPLREFEVLEALITNPGRVFSRHALMRRVWGETPPSGTKSLDVHIRRIRARIEDDPSKPQRIVTVRGVGYRYEP